jgi:anti-sigma factor RsiW
MSVLGTDDHQWSQRHLSHYAEGDLAPRARRRLDRHAAGCPDCGRGLRAVRALRRVLAAGGGDPVRAPASILDRARAAHRADAGGAAASEA